MYKKSVMHVQSCCFANQTYCFFAVLVAVRVVVAKAPYYMDRRVTPPNRVTSPTWGPPPPRKQAPRFKTLKPVPYLAASQRHITRLGQIKECPLAW